MKDIVQQGDPVLRDVASFIEPEKISSQEIQSVISQMHASLATQRDGVALAAPQIGISLQIFVVSPKIFKKHEQPSLVYINPKIIRTSEKKDWLDEGCLSCRWKVGQVKRSLEATIQAYNEDGELFEEAADGLLAHIYQHETDHLHGILFLDKARNVRDMTEEEIKEVTG